MKSGLLFTAIATIALLGTACRPAAVRTAGDAGTGTAVNMGHLGNLRQLTFGGQNAEAYFSADGSKIIFQSTRDGFGCDQIFTMNLDGSDVRLVSTGRGRTTCSFFSPDAKEIVYASTHLGDDECPAEPDRSRGYVWALYPDYDIFAADPDGSNVRRLTDTPGYDAEASYSPDGSRMVFTSVRDGDLELYTMKSDGTDVKRLTHKAGFDGGPFFSWDGRYIVYRSHYPENEEELADYQALLKENLQRPVLAEIYYMKADGSEQVQVTDTGHANWSPFMHPDGRQIIFSSNMHDPDRRTFSLYMVNTDGSGLERITYDARFDSFPMFSKDGTKLIFSSTRNAKERREFNIFVADWIP